MNGEKISRCLDALPDAMLEEAMKPYQPRSLGRHVVRIAAVAAVLALVMTWLLWPGDTEDDETIILPPTRWGAGEMHATLAKKYTFETAFVEADVVARVQVRNWLGEDTTISSTYYDAVVLECFKGDIPESFTLIQDGSSKGTLKKYPLLTYGNELLLFMNEATGVSYESAYWIIGAFTTMLDVAYDDEGVRYYVDRYSILGDTMTEAYHPAILESIGEEVYAYILERDPVIEEILVRDSYIFRETDVWDWMESP